MRAKFGRTVRTAGVALALALGAGVILGTAPASAASVTYDIQLRHHGSSIPSSSAAQDETRAAADRKCVQTYGYRAREIQPYSLWGKKMSDGSHNWYQAWKCISN